MHTQRIDTNGLTGEIEQEMQSYETIIHLSALSVCLVSCLLLDNLLSKPFFQIPSKSVPGLSFIFTRFTLLNNQQTIFFHSGVIQGPIFFKISDNFCNKNRSLFTSFLKSEAGFNGISHFFKLHQK